MASPHNVPNIAPGVSIPSGYLLGRISPGTGRHELISMADIARQMVALGVVAPPGAAFSTPLSVVNGGTGQSSYTNGQLLIGNTTGNTLTKATLTAPAAGITITNGTGSITFGLGNDLAALEAMASTGIVTRTAAETYALRTITGTANRLTVTNGDGVSGNPTLDIHTSYVGQNTITTLGTIGTGVWQGTKVNLTYGGTNADLSATGGANQFLKQSSAGAAITVGQPTYADIGSGVTTATATGLTISGGTLSGATTLPGTGTITSGGLLYLGYGSALTFGATNNQGYQVIGGSGLAAAAGRNALGNFAANTNPSALAFGKSRGTVSAAATVADGDGLGQLDFFADDGSTNGAFPILSAEIRAEVDGTVGTGIIPSHIDFATTNSAGTRATRWRIQPSGLFSAISSVATVPALKRSSTVMEHRLGDDSAYCPIAASESRVYGGENGQFLNIKSLTELTTIAAAATTTTTIQIPADAQVIGVSVRVTVVIPTAATFTCGVSGTAARYGTGISTAANTTAKGMIDGIRYYAAATGILITPNLTPAANTGRVRVTIYYLEMTAPTS